MPGMPGFLQHAAQPLPGQPECCKTLTAEVAPLLELIDFAQLSAIIDTHSGTGTIAAEFKKVGLRVVTNDINIQHKAQHHLDTLQPASYKQLRSLYGRRTAFVTSPWFRMLDIVLPLTVLASPQVACMHVPGHYLTDAHPARLQYLRSLLQQGRLVTVMGLPRSVMGRRCLWLLIFASALVRQRLMKGSHGNIVMLDLDAVRF